MSKQQAFAPLGVGEIIASLTLADKIKLLGGKVSPSNRPALCQGLTLVCLGHLHVRGRSGSWHFVPPLLRRSERCEGKRSTPSIDQHTFKSTVAVAVGESARSMKVKVV
jgi:hypothetical protein